MVVGRCIGGGVVGGWQVYWWWSAAGCLGCSMRINMVMRLDRM